jgi:hypothetical protein
VTIRYVPNCQLSALMFLRRPNDFDTGNDDHRRQDHGYPWMPGGRLRPIHIGARGDPAGS